jgi:uncharacterized protein
MPRKYFRKYLPSHDSIRQNRFVARFGPFLQHPNLWHLNRDSVSGGVAVGLFAGLVPGPLQMLTALLIAVPLRVNLPVAVLLTLYTNPFTIFPLYWLAYQVGAWVLAVPGEITAAPPDFSWGAMGAWLNGWIDYLAALGKPLVLGLFIMASSFAATGYVLARAGWSAWVRVSWQRRKDKRARET